MAIAMKLHYVDVIQDNSLKNVYVNGKKDGYKFDIRLSCYRGHFLCLHGKEFGISQLHDLVSEFWQIIEPATIKVFKNGGLLTGEHEIDFKMIYRCPYMPISDTEYMPWDSGQKKTLTIAE